MQPYIYMSIGIRGDGLTSEDIESLEALNLEGYIYTEGFEEEDQVFALEVLYNPWDKDEYSATKTISIEEINTLYRDNRDKIIKYQNKLKTVELSHLVDKVDVIVHVTEM